MLKLTESLAAKAHSYRSLISKTQGCLHTFLPPGRSSQSMERQYKVLVNCVGLSCTAWEHAATLQWCDLGQEMGLPSSVKRNYSKYLPHRGTGSTYRVHGKPCTWNKAWHLLFSKHSSSSHHGQSSAVFAGLDPRLNGNTGHLTPNKDPPTWNRDSTPGGGRVQPIWKP